jgi:dipeptidyl-peptidase-3
VRPAVLKKKTPRKVFVQANTVEKAGKVELKEYEASNEGMIQSCVDREYV